MIIWKYVPWQLNIKYLINSLIPFLLTFWSFKECYSPWCLCCLMKWKSQQDYFKLLELEHVVLFCCCFQCEWGSDCACVDAGYRFSALLLLTLQAERLFLHYGYFGNFCPKMRVLGNYNTYFESQRLVYVCTMWSCQVLLR